MKTTLIFTIYLMLITSFAQAAGIENLEVSYIGQSDDCIQEGYNHCEDQLDILGLLNIDLEETCQVFAQTEEDSSDFERGQWAINQFDHDEESYTLCANLFCGDSKVVTNQCITARHSQISDSADAIQDRLAEITIDEEMNGQDYGLMAEEIIEIL